MGDVILTINAGSSSVKFAQYTVGEDGALTPEAEGQLEGIGTHPHLYAKESGGDVLIDGEPDEVLFDGRGPTGELIRRLLNHQNLLAVGHRVAHGGEFDRPIFCTEENFAKMEALTPLAPLHQPYNLAPIRMVNREFPGLFQVACFDTMFHRGHRPAIEHFAIPLALYDEGIRRYGFHGLSYEYIARTLRKTMPEIARGRVVVAHLGSGVSMCGISNGKSVDSTMGFTALDGLPMGTRSGEIDPGVILYLLQQKGWSDKQVERLLYKDSGLKGLSGISNDMRDLETNPDPNAQLAVENFVYRIAFELAGLASSMGGIDALVFTAGIGEHSKTVRAKVLEGSAWLGFELDPERNDANGPLITTPGSRLPAFVIPTDEQLMIARHTFDTIAEQVALFS
jgi:acetate kinase